MYLNQEFEGGNKALRPGILGFTLSIPVQTMGKYSELPKNKNNEDGYKHKLILVQYWNLYC